MRATWDRSDSAARELIDKLSGRHPHALVLLARQMGRRGMTLSRLRDEARADLLRVLADPLAADDEEDRMKKAEVSYSLSYRHLSEPAKRFFERLSRFPGGVWCGEPGRPCCPGTRSWARAGGGLSRGSWITTPSCAGSRIPAIPPGGAS